MPRNSLCLLTFITSILFFIRTEPVLASPLSPAEYFGHQMGADRKLVGWTKIVEYFELLDRSSDRLSIETLGESTLGRRFIMATIAQPEVLLNLDATKAIQRQLAHPEDLSDQEAHRIAKEAKIVVMITMSIHSTEIASSQEAMELAWRLATEESEEVKKILEKAVVLMIPSLNPDGIDIVVDWYKKYLGTDHEGSPLPFLYHHYAGHDNNRDWFMMNLVETRLASKQFYEEWYPQIIYDQHQMRVNGPRMFLPPFTDPVNPNVNPLVLSEINMLGKSIVNDMQELGLKGIVTNAFYTSWWEGASIMTPWWHNQIGILSELASVWIATPLYFPPGSLVSSRRGLTEYKQRVNFLDPWRGGWWRLRDIVDYELAVAFSLLRHAAAEKERFIYNFYRMNRDAMEQGKSDPPFAFVIPRAQHDPLAATKMLEALRQGGVTIMEAKDRFSMDGRSFPRGTWVIPLAQAFRPYIYDMFARQRYPELREYPGGPPLRPYDVTGWTFPLLMGVEVVEAEELLSVPMKGLDRIVPPAGGVHGEAERYALLSHNSNESFILTNRLLEDGVPIYWASEPFSLNGSEWPVGTIIIENTRKLSSRLGNYAKELHQELFFVDALPDLPALKFKELRLGLYQPWTPSMDEGWTRYLFDTYEFPYKTLHNADIRSGEFRKRISALILPSMTTDQIVEGKMEWLRGYPPRPPAYQGGIGEEGIEAVKTFVREGGALIALNRSAAFVVEELDIPVVNVLDNVPDTEFFAPGTLLRLLLDPMLPLAYGMPEQVAGYFADSPAFRLRPQPAKNMVVAWYPRERLLESGWILGEKKIAGQAAVVDLAYGKGRVMLLGFGVQNRAQTHSTFPLLFNACYLGNANKELVHVPSNASK